MVRKTVTTTVVRPRRRPRPRFNVYRKVKATTILDRNKLNLTQLRKQIKTKPLKRLVNKRRPRPMRQMLPAMSQATKQYMHCRMNPFQSSGLLGIPDLADQPRVVVDHRLICNFTVGTSGGFNIAIMPWLPHPLLVQPLVMNDATWLYNGVHPTANNSALNTAYYFAPATFKEWANQAVFRRNQQFDIDSVDVPYSSSRFRFVTIGAKLIYTGSTLNNAGTILVNDGGFTSEQVERNNQEFNVLTSASAGIITYTADEVSQTMINFTPVFDVRSNSSLNTPIKTGSYMLLKNQASDHPWLPIMKTLNFPTGMSSSGLSDYCNMIANVDDPLATGLVYGYPCLQAWDSHFCPKLISINGVAPGTPFQIELVYCVEYAIDPSSSIVSLAKQPIPDPKGVQMVDQMLRDQPGNLPLGNEIVKTIGTTISDSVGAIATAFSPVPHFQLPQRRQFSTRLQALT